MNDHDEKAEQIEQLTGTSDLAEALDSEHFRQFLDQVPIAIAVSDLRHVENIVYANLEFERLSGRSAKDIVGGGWEQIDGFEVGADAHTLGHAVVYDTDYIGAFNIPHPGASATVVDAWSNQIQDDEGIPAFRLVALVAVGERTQGDIEKLKLSIEDKDTLLRELQHRVKNNLQMITALIRLEARNLPEGQEEERFDRLAGRIEALGLLYNSLSETEHEEEIDLGIYLSEVASAVMHAHASQGIRIETKVDTWLASINTAMPAGLVVNELLTNALKHAFIGRDGGTIQLHSLVTPTGCRVTVADDGVGLPDGVEWPKPGKLSSLIVKSLKQNAKANVTVESKSGCGVKVEINFDRAPIEQ
ncbi:sensor histidine kinase [Pseudomonas bohemica]|uniref:sensor histidine kinase n=1 Tax=Pseudomonas bohemica TaxID=2044872 RepID=UPI000DA600FA|nr:histidine kinase dimerization/phosphoacceptor domain -containing protein [Pseudomonas bohemica]